MTDAPRRPSAQPAGKSAMRQERADRLAAALRQNLRRRKQHDRGLGSSPPPDGAGPEELALPPLERDGPSQ